MAPLFFMLTGFHGVHVLLGTIILIITLIRVMKGHYNSKNHFGFEAASWYWHFVDVVWVGLFPNSIYILIKLILGLEGMIKRYVALICLVFFSSGLLAEESSSIKALDFVVKLLPPQVTTTAAFGTLISNRDDSLIGVSSPISEVSEIHVNSISESGIMKMRKINNIDLPANKKVKLNHGGVHIMLIGLKSPLSEGQKVPLTLSFKSGKKLSVTARVAKMMGMKKGMHKNMKKDKMKGMHKNDNNDH